MSHQQTRPAQDKVCGYEYTVRRGDSFYLIAQRLGIPLRDLLEANTDINPARLMVGDVLCIPMEEDDAPQPAEPAPQQPASPEPAPLPLPTPEVSAGDDLDTPAAMPDSAGQDTVMDDAILVCPEANRYIVGQGETAADIQLKTNLNLHTLQSANPGVDLTKLRPGQTLCIPAQNTACPAAMTYTLQNEDTLESAALRLNASLSALLRANPCLAPSDFRAGVCIWVPEM